MKHTTTVVYILVQAAGSRVTDWGGTVLCELF